MTWTWQSFSWQQPIGGSGDSGGSGKFKSRTFVKTPELKIKDATAEIVEERLIGRSSGGKRDFQGFTKSRLIAGVFISWRG